MPITATITNAGHNFLRDLLKQQSIYIAVGTSNTTPSSSDTRLGNEVYRKVISSLTNGANPGEFLASIYIGAGEIIGTNIEEIGVFVGGSASGQPNTGILLTRGLFHHPNKAKNESILAQQDITI